MKVLIAENDPVIRDQLLVGLQAFGDMQTDCATGLIALDKVRRADYDFLVLGLDTSTGESRDLFEKIRAENQDIEVLIVAPDSVIQQIREEKVRGRIFGFLKNPLEPVEFFRMVSRLRHRRDPATSRSS